MKPQIKLKRSIKNITKKDEFLKDTKKKKRI